MLRDGMMAMIRDGMSLRRVCKAYSVSRSTFDDWRKLGEAGEEPYCKFFEEAALVGAEIEGQYLRRAQELAMQTKDNKTALQSIIWYLERVRGYQNDARKPDAEDGEAAPEPPKFVVQLAMPERPPPSSDDN